MQHPLGLELGEEQLAVRPGAFERAAVEQRGPRREPALRTAHLRRGAHEGVTEVAGEAVQRVAFGHGAIVSHADVPSMPTSGRPASTTPGPTW